jgi:hypothetical protein
MLAHAMEIVRASSRPMAVLWGAEFFVHFNDACRSVIGDRYPMVAGRPAVVAWSELWEAAGHRAELALRGEASAMTAVRLAASRDGQRVETRYDVVFSPLPGEAGGAAGVLCAFNEIPPDEPGNSA